MYAIPALFTHDESLVDTPCVPVNVVSPSREYGERKRKYFVHSFHKWTSLLLLHCLLWCLLTKANNARLFDSLFRVTRERRRKREKERERYRISDYCCHPTTTNREIAHNIVRPLCQIGLNCEENLMNFQLCFHLLVIVDFSSFVSFFARRIIFKILTSILLFGQQSIHYIAEITRQIGHSAMNPEMDENSSRRCRCFDNFFFSMRWREGRSSLPRFTCLSHLHIILSNLPHAHSVFNDNNEEITNGMNEAIANLWFRLLRRWLLLIFDSFVCQIV